MNKKLFAVVSVGVIALILVLWATLRLSPLGHSHTLLSDSIGAVLVVLAFPMRLYAMVMGEDAHWPLALLFLFLALSGSIWGVIVERVAFVFSKRKPIA